MGIKRQVVAYSICIEPRSLGGRGACFMSDNLAEPDETRRMAEYRKRCEEMVEQIKRHVDGVGFVKVNAEIEIVCEHCGATWTEDETDSHNGGCCDADAELAIAAVEGD